MRIKFVSFWHYFYIHYFIKQSTSGAKSHVDILFHKLIALGLCIDTLQTKTDNVAFAIIFSIFSS